MNLYSFFKIALAKIAMAFYSLNSVGKKATYSFMVLVLMATVFLAACKKDLGNAGGKGGNFKRSSSASFEDNRNIPDISGASVIPNVISTSMTLTNDKQWIINGPTFVLSGATLTIEEGTYIRGKKKANTPNNYPSFLLIAKGADIVANGTAEDPIVFTSEGTACNRAPGDWGGIVICGNGRTNAGVGSIEGMQSVYYTSQSLPASTIQYGDNNDNDDSGSLKYVRIEFAGDVLQEGNELNGLTLGAVGYNTDMDHIQVSMGADDGFEFFGGSVNATHLISYGNNDDDFDFDQGYIGAIQFAVSVKVPCLTYSTSPNGIESNDVTSPVTSNNLRLTRPVLSNFTILGEDNNDGPGAGGTSTSGTGTLFRANSNFVVRNFLVGGFYTGSNTTGASASGAYSYSYIQGFTNTGLPGPLNNPPYSNVADDSGTGTSANSWLALVDPFNVYNCMCSTVGSQVSPDFRYVNDPDGSGIISPANGGDNYSGLSVTNPGGSLTSFTTGLGYIGAFGDQNSTRWDDLWATYSPNSNFYL